LASQRVEAALFGGLLLTELTSPLSVQLGGVDHDHLGVLGDGVLRHDALQFLMRLLGDVTVDLLTALLRLALEVALLDLNVQASLDGLDELVLGLVALVDDDGRGGLDLGFLVLSGLLLERVLALEALLESGVGLTILVLVQTGADDALELTFGVTASAALNGGQSQLESGRRDDGIFVVVFVLGLLVQLGGQLGIGLFEFLQQLETRLALAALLLTTALLLLLAATLALELVLLILFLFVQLVVLLFLAVVFGLVIVQVQAAVALIAARALTVALALLLLVVVIFILVLVLVLVIIVQVVQGQALTTVATLFLAALLLLLQGADQTVETVAARVTCAGDGQAKSDQDEETHDVQTRG
jgi:hypothetical protein